MSDEATFRDLIQRVRQGDPDAAAELVRSHEKEIRRIIRFKLEGSKLQRVLDSVDIYQSVMANFFVRAAAGQFDLQEPTQLVKLLVTMAKNRLTDKARQEDADKRGGGKGGSTSDSLVLGGLPDPGSSPSVQVERAELLARVHELLSAEERELVELRQQGLEWAEIGVRVGKKVDAVRRQHERALDRVAEQMRLDELTVT